MTSLRGSGALARLIVRLDRLRLTLWIVGIVALVVVSANSVAGLYDTPQEQVTYATLVGDNPTSIVVNGPGIGLGEPGIGVIFVAETLIWGALLSAVMSVFLVLRHTRTEEESERADLLRARVVGRHAPLAAAVGVVTGAHVLIAALNGAGLVALGLPVTGAVASALAMGAAGVAFVGVGAVAAQLTSTTRGGLGWAMGAVGVAYALRAVGDIGDGTLSWLSPLGWVHQVRPYASERWWVLGLSVALGGTLTVTASWLSTRRDLGSGLIATRLGPPSLAPWSGHPVGLVLRLQRGAIAGWSAGLALLGVLYGGVARDVEEMLAENPELADYIGQVEGASFVDSYLAYTLVLGAMLASGAAIASVGRHRAEEAAGRAELILAGPTSRSRWLGAHLVAALLTSVLLLAASGAGTGLGVALSTDDRGAVIELTWASLVHLPAVVVLLGVAAALQGAAPRWAAAAWGVFVGSLTVGLLAQLLGLPSWVRSLSPFEHSPNLPAAAGSPTEVLALTAVGIALVGVAVTGFLRRDIPAV